MAKRRDLSTRIKDLMLEGPLVFFYLVTAVDVLKDYVDNMSNKELYKAFGGLLHPDRIRRNVGDMQKKLNEE